jgi:putative restriction endonuclease
MAKLKSGRTSGWCSCQTLLAEATSEAKPLQGGLARVHNSHVRSYVGVTDGEWYRYLAVRPGLREVNFWRPSGGGRFGALSVGEPFFFKTHYPDNRVVGGGFYSDFAAMTASEAWALFGEGNGAASLEQMLARVGRYRRTPIAPGEDPIIGCVFIRDVCFFPSDESAPPPPDFAANIVQGKS